MSDDLRSAACSRPQGSSRPSRRWHSSRPTHSRTCPCPGSDPSAARGRIPGRRSRASLLDSSHRRGCLHQLRLRDTGRAGPDASATRRGSVTDCGQYACESRTGIHPRTRTVHPREVDAKFAHGVVRNYWGGSSSTTTLLLDAMHYKGLLRVARREAGIRIYAIQRHGPPPQSAALRRARIDALVDVVVRKYSPIPSVSLSFLLRRLRYAVPQWRGEIGGALERARHRLSRARVDGETWYWPSEVPARARCHRRTPYGCSLRSIRSSGTASASSGFGDGPIGSKRTRRWRSESLATMRSRSSGAIRLSGGPTSHSERVNCMPSSAMSAAPGRVRVHLPGNWTPRSSGCASFSMEGANNW